MPRESGGTHLLGRDKELEAVERVLARARAGIASALVVEGPAGIGKTTLLAAAAERAADFERVRIAGHEMEAALGGSGLASLALAWPALEGPERARLRDAARGGRVEPLAIGAALHALATRRAERAPVLLVIDDAQWLDAASAAALAFAVHRFAADRIAVVAAARPGAPDLFPRAERLALGALDSVGCRALVATRFALPPRVVERCIEVTGGNPLALLHVCEALSREQRSGAEPIEMGALPKRLRAAFEAKLAALPDASQRALAVVAAGAGGERLAETLAEVDARLEDLRAAEAAGIVALAGRPRLAHPLWAPAILEHGGPALRRRAHAAIAAHEADPDRAVLHRAAAAERADEAVARELDALAARSIERGLVATAARASSAAAALSESEPARRRRELAAARAFWDASLPAAAAAILDRVIDAPPDPHSRVEVVLLRNQIRAFTEDARGAVLALRAEADRARTDAPELEAAVLAVATVASLLAADAPLGVEMAERCTRCAAAGAASARARALLGYAALHLGDGSHADAVAALEAFAEVPEACFDYDALELVQIAGYALLVRERWDDAERALRAVVAQAARRGFVSIQAFASALLAEIEFRRGRWLDALAVATVDIALSEAQAEGRAALGHAVAAHVLAHQGDAEPCERRAGHALRAARSMNLASIEAFAHVALGAASLARGDAAAAVRELDAVWAIRLRGGVAEPGVVWYQGDYVEALIAVGRSTDAAAVVRELERIADATGGAWARAIAARGRALLGRGAAREAIAAAEALPAPFEIARTRLALVEHGRLDAASADLAGALDTFERLGARPWAARARRLLGAGGEPMSSLAQQLTEAELRVALLVGRGHTNAAVGERLVISVRTVDAHLRSIFRKLGLKSRSELVVRVASERGRD